MENSKNIKKTNHISGERLVSVDVFRGVTIAAMILVINPGSWKFIYPQLRHANWHGCTFTDLIFPFFLFIVGVSIVFAFSKALEKNFPKSTLYYKIIKRTVILFLLGLFLNSFPQFDLVNIRIMGVLQRIAICYFFVSILFLHTKLRVQIIVAISLLLVYWALMEWMVVPGIGAGHYEKNANFATYFDRFFLQGHMGYYEKLGEPEGLISTLPALSSTLFGVLTGHVFKKNIDAVKKTLMLLSFGVLAVILGKIWGNTLPVNKHLWTGSYALLTAGFATVACAALYFIIDVKGNSKGFKPFLVFGMNAITVYVLSIIVARIIGFIRFTAGDGLDYSLKSWLYTHVFAEWFGDLNGSLAYALVYILIWLGIMWIFYKRKIFIKI